jgi:predicted CXXCH cytochrome family protein
MAVDPHRPHHPHRLIVAALACAIVPLAGWATVRELDASARERGIAAVVPQSDRAGYATSERCEACHPSQYHSWHRGFHRSMTQYATPATVRGDFADRSLRGAGYEVQLSRRGDEFFVAMVDPLWQYQIDIGKRQPAAGEVPPRVERRISMVTGSHHMQAYWVPSNQGNGQLSMPFTYLFDDQRWVPRGEVFLHPPGERHEEQVWNIGCITCHTTAGRPGALGSGWDIRTELGEQGIACESCHGPAEAHVAANQNPVRRYLQHVRGGGDPTIVNPARLPVARRSQVCGQCHALTELSDDIELGNGRTYVPGAELEATQPLLRPLHPTPELARRVREDPLYLRNYFWSDGTIRVSSRDYSGMIESKCTSGGEMWCGTCHSLHDSDPANLLARGKDGDAACASCHAAIVAAPAAHSHHLRESDGSRCANCHMPHTVYGLLRGIRNHRIDSPHVTGRSGGHERPNACNLCHVDRSLAWTAQQLERWYHQPVAANLAGGATAAAIPVGPAAAAATPMGAATAAATTAGAAPVGVARAEPATAGVADPGEAAAIEWLVSGDAVLRAVAAWHFGWEPARRASAVTMAMPYLVVALNDPYSAVRYVAGHAVMTLMPGIRYDYLAEPAARQQVAQDVLARWLAGSPQTPESAAAIDARIQRLLEQRDTTAVRAME